MEIHPTTELSPTQRKRWIEIQEANPDLQNPYFRIEFAESVARLHPGGEVAVWYRGDDPIAFYPYQRKENSVASPVGDQIGCFHGVVCARESNFDVGLLIHHPGFRSIRFDHLLASQPWFSPWHYEVLDSPYIDLQGGFDAYRERRKAKGHSNRAFAELGRKARRLQEEKGPVQLLSDCRDVSVLDTLVGWKQQQMALTGRRDLFSQAPWVLSFLRESLEKKDPAFRGMLSALTVDGAVVAAHFALRSRDRLHGLFFGFDRKYAAHSPGMILVLKMVQELETEGIVRIHMGKGDERYKQMWKSGSHSVAVGGYERKRINALLRPRLYRARRWVSTSQLGPFAKEVRGRSLRFKDGLLGHSG